MLRHSIDRSGSLRRPVRVALRIALLCLGALPAAACSLPPSSSVERTADAQQSLATLVSGLLVTRTAEAQMQTAVVESVLATLAAEATLTPQPTPTPTPSPTPTILPTPDPTVLAALPKGRTRISHRGNALQIYIPLGAYIIGSNANDDNRAPMHAVFLDAFWIDQMLVTNAQFAQCVEAGRCTYHVSFETNPRFTDPAYASHPVTYVRWQDAVDYCTWQGGRLPSEAEWEAAARGPYGRTNPWGEQTASAALANIDEVVNDTTPVGSYPDAASYYGVLDMVGNVRQWVSDWYDPLYYWTSPLRNPQGPDTGEMRVLRGSCFTDPGWRSWASTRYAHVPDSAGATRGFRCAASPP